MGCAVRATETHNATKRSFFAWWRCVFQAGPSNPQQGFVGADRAKVQRESSGLLGPFVSEQFDFIHPSARTSTGRPSPGRPVGSSDTSGLGAVRAGAVSV
jgi:hypothetical protein